MTLSKDKNKLQKRLLTYVRKTYSINIKNINPKQKGDNRMPGGNGTGPLTGRGYFSYRRPRIDYGRGYYLVDKNTEWR